MLHACPAEAVVEGEDGVKYDRMWQSYNLLCILTSEHLLEHACACIHIVENNMFIKKRQACDTINLKQSFRECLLQIKQLILPLHVPHTKRDLEV